VQRAALLLWIIRNTPEEFSRRDISDYDVAIRGILPRLASAGSDCNAKHLRRGTTKPEVLRFYKLDDSMTRASNVFRKSRVEGLEQLRKLGPDVDRLIGGLASDVAGAVTEQPATASQPKMD
jgi:hypothetical protein